MSSSAEAVAWAWRQPIDRPGAKFVLVALAGEATRVKDGPMVAEPGMAKLQRLTGMSESTVVRNLRWLVDHVTGMTKERGEPDAQGRRSRDRFTLPVSIAVGVASQSERQHAKRQSGIGQTRKMTDGQTVKMTSPKLDIPESQTVILREQVLKELTTTTRTSSSEMPPTRDVIDLCNRLADRIEGNGSKRPTVGRRWHEACRLMIEQDDRTPEQIAAAIDWCQADSFWQANILSMPKLREKYDQLRLIAQRQRSGSAPPPSRAMQGMELAMRLRSEGR